jgi:hypothetical protein
MIANPLKVKDLISEKERDGIGIPEIQRTYVWRRTQTAKLLDSIYRGFPAGSILLWDTMQEVQTREMATNLGRDARHDFPPKIVLDGQQRLTSLCRVFDKKTPKDERMIFNVVNEAFEPYSPRNAADPRWIDVTGLLTDTVTELEVLSHLKEAGTLKPNDSEEEKAIFKRLKKLGSIRDYQFPVEIVREDDLEVVTEIFIRVNSAGTRLREAELALARLAWKLPGSIVRHFDQMESSCLERGFELDSRFLMRSLVSTATRQSRFRDLKAFWKRPAEDIEREWKRTEKGIRLALDFVEGNVGIPGSELLPSHASLIPLTVIFSQRQAITGQEERMLRRWFVVANAFSRYVGATETTLNQDLAALGSECENISALLDQCLRDLRAEPKITPQDLERAGTNSPFFCLAFLAIIRQDAADWFKGIKIRRESFAEDQQIEYHHIFPKKLLNARGVDRYLRDEMANLAFLGQRANRRILSREPADYLAEIASHDARRLEAQFVPMDRELWKLDRFGDFLAARRQLLADAMNRELIA